MKSSVYMERLTIREPTVVHRCLLSVLSACLCAEGGNTEQTEDCMICRWKLKIIPRHPFAAATFWPSAALDVLFFCPTALRGS